MRIENDGPRVLSTDYYSSEPARRGLIYVSVNAGAFRVLLPPALEAEAAEMCRAQYVIVTRGVYETREALEMLFEDGSAVPYSLHVDARMTDRRLPRADEGRTDLRCLVYGPGPTLLCELPARYRRAARLPYLRPWGPS